MQRWSNTFLCYFTSAYPPLVCGPCFCDLGSNDPKTLCSRNTTNSHVDLWTKVINRLPVILLLTSHSKVFSSIIILLQLLQKTKKINAYLNVCSQLWCRLHLQVNSKKKCEIFHSSVIMWSPKPLLPLLFYFPC